MFFRILKKDLKRKKSINIVLFIFMMNGDIYARSKENGMEFTLVCPMS